MRGNAGTPPARRPGLRETDASKLGLQNMEIAGLFVLATTPKHNRIAVAFYLFIR
jgi:hypothetical protein